MNRIIAIACAAAIGLSAAHAAMAQQGGKPPVDCRDTRQPCPPPAQQHQRQQPPNDPKQKLPQHGQNQANAQQRPNQGQGQRPPQQGQNHHARPGDQQRPPRVGQRARNGQPFHQAQNSRLPRPPRGQEYRIYDGHVVRVDSNTLKIVAVVGLLSVLLNN